MVAATFKDPLFIASNGSADITYAADEWRDLVAAIAANGGGLRDNNSYAPIPAGTLTVGFNPGLALIPGTNSGAADAAGLTPQGFYTAHMTDDGDGLTFSAGPTGGQSRLDLIIVRIYDGAVIGSGPKKATLEIVAGTPGTPGAAPAVPASSIVVGAVRMNTSATAISGTSTNDNDFNTVLVSSTYRNVNTPPGMAGRFVDLTSAQSIAGAKTFSSGVARGSGRVLKSTSSVMRRAATQLLTSASITSTNYDTGAWTQVNWDTVAQHYDDEGALADVANNRMLCPATALYDGHIIVSFPAVIPPSGIRGLRVRTLGGGLIDQAMVTADNFGFLPARLKCDYTAWPVTANDHLIVEILQTQGSSLTLPASGGYFSTVWSHRISG